MTKGASETCESCGAARELCDCPLPPWREELREILGEALRGTEVVRENSDK